MHVRNRFVRAGVIGLLLCALAITPLLVGRAYAPPSSFDIAKESDANASQFFTTSVVKTVSAAALAWDSAALLAAPGANKAYYIDYFDFFPTSTNKTAFVLIDGDSLVIHKFIAGSNAATQANNFKPIHRRVTANKAVWIKNVDAALALDIEVTIGYRIVEEY